MPNSAPQHPLRPGPSTPSERTALIDLQALAHNVRTLKALAGGAQLIAVVKADAYGHGAVPCAQTAVEHGADMLGVAHVREALELRAAGIQAPVLAWLHTVATDFGAALETEVQLGVSGWELEPVAAAARERGLRAVVHLKADTGLGRNGATAAAWPDLVARAAELEAEGVLEVRGIFTHLAVADEPERPETQQQLEAFQSMVAQAERAGLRPAMVHAANSPATLASGQAPDPQAVTRDSVRVGLALYGLSPLAGRSPQELGLRPVMTLQTFVDSVKTVPAGQGVSYGLNYRTTSPTTLALVPMGYADGVPRVATGGPVRIYPSGAPPRTFRVVGRIAMDQMVVDLGEPGLEDPALGYLHAPAVLFGTGENPPVEEWAEAAGTINYEIVTRISGRVDRMALHPGPAPEQRTGAETTEEPA